MAKKRYIGAAILQAQLDTATVGGTIEATDLFKLTIGAKTLIVVAGSTVAADVAEAIATAWQKLDSAAYPEFAEITAQANAATVIFEANEPGKPFTLTVVSTESNGDAADAQTFSITTTTANSGPNDISCVDNWSGEALPVNGDDIIIDMEAPSLLWNVEALAAVVPASVRITCGRNTRIGLGQTDDGGYPQYRPKAFKTRCASWYVNTDSGFVNLFMADGTAGAMLVHKTGQRDEDTRAALCLQGSNATHTLTLMRGDVAISQADDEVAQFGTVSVSYMTAVDSDASLYVGPAATMGAWVQNGGQCETWAALSSFTQRAGFHRHNSGGITSPLVYGGTLEYNATETLAGNAKVSEPGILDFGADPRAKTVTNPIERFGKAGVRDPFNVVNTAGSFVIDNNETSDLTGIVIGANRRMTFAATA